MSSHGDDIDTMPEGQLLTLPEGSVPPGLLTMLWARHSNVLYQRRIEELNLELSGTYARHTLLYPGQDPHEKHRLQEEENRRRAWAAYEQSMFDIEQRREQLLADIDAREQEIERHRKDIEDRALKLHDGRRVYFDGDNYRDEQGRVLSGTDAREADAQHRQHPDAPSWQERQQTIDQQEEMERLRQKLLKEKQDAAADGQNLSTSEIAQRQHDAERNMSAYEQEFSADVDAAKAGIAKKPDIASAYNTLSLDDYAGPSGGAGKSSTSDFARAAAGITGTPQAPDITRTSASGIPKVDI